MIASVCMTSSWHHCKYINVEILDLEYHKTFCLQNALQQQLLINVWFMCMVKLLQLLYSKQMALNKFTRGRQSLEGYPCSSRPSDATNHLSAAAMDSWFWKTEE